ncbi:hypothetical protein [Actinoplanes sp. NPDC049118]|uniref:hypothetical protein n=1 Tax=Actinoplanes sp. NPDC049118 TaxID=3155769 RepID=UPI0033CF876C
MTVLWDLFQQLRRRGLAVGPAEYEAVRQALRSGHGLSSRAELRAVCTAVWAKSRAEQAVVGALFDQHFPDEWRADDVRPEKHASAGAWFLPTARDANRPGPAKPGAEPAPGRAALTIAATGRLPALRVTEPLTGPAQHIFLPQFPVDQRTVAQAWRRLRWSVREGPATELDVDATVRRRSDAGVVTPPALRPRRRNRAKLLLLVDRQGSMAPFHTYVEEVCRTIRSTGQLREVEIRYFHDIPLQGNDPAMLTSLGGSPFPSLDPVLGQIQPLTDGILMTDDQLTVPASAFETLERYARNAAVAVISDGGAARGRYDLLRLFDTVAFVKGLHTWTRRIVWLNPLPPDRWTGSTAAQIARHVPMFPMTVAGMHRAVNLLRGHPARVPRPVGGGTE